MRLCRAFEAFRKRVKKSDIGSEICIVCTIEKDTYSLSVLTTLGCTVPCLTKHELTNWTFVCPESFRRVQVGETYFCPNQISCTRLCRALLLNNDSVSGSENCCAEVFATPPNLQQLLILHAFEHTLLRVPRVFSGEQRRLF